MATAVVAAAVGLAAAAGCALRTRCKLPWTRLDPFYLQVRGARGTQFGSAAVRQYRHTSPQCLGSACGANARAEPAVRTNNCLHLTTPPYQNTASPRTRLWLRRNSARLWRPTARLRATVRGWVGQRLPGGRARPMGTGIQRVGWCAAPWPARAARAAVRTGVEMVWACVLRSVRRKRGPHGCGVGRQGCKIRVWCFEVA